LRNQKGKAILTIPLVVVIVVVGIQLIIDIIGTEQVQVAVGICVLFHL
jgi:hypothetical protein